MAMNTTATLANRIDTQTTGSGSRPESSVTLQTLTAHPDPEIRAAAAASEFTPPEELEALTANDTTPKCWPRRPRIRNARLGCWHASPPATCSGSATGSHGRGSARPRP